MEYLTPETMPAGVAGSELNETFLAAIVGRSPDFYADARPGVRVGTCGLIALR